MGLASCQCCSCSRPAGGSKFTAYRRQHQVTDFLSTILIRRIIDSTMPDGNVADPDSEKPCPSIHMPRRASCLTLILSDVKFEQLPDINRANAGADGVEFETANLPSWYVSWI